MVIPLHGLERIRLHGALQISSLLGEFVSDRGIILRRIAREDLNRIQERMVARSGAWMYRACVQYEVVKEFQCSAKDSDEFEVAIETVKRELNDLLAALRLLKHGAIDFDGLEFLPLWKKLEGNKEPLNALSRVAVTPKYQMQGLPSYTLDLTDYDSLRHLLAKVREHALLDRFSFSRFMDSYHRDNYLDRILDCVICLDGLLVPDSGSELKYRFSTRGTVLTSESSAEREKSFMFFKDLYDLRSVIVHGSTTVDDKKIRKLLASLHPDGSPMSVANAVMEITRNVICKYLENPDAFKPDALDRAVLGLGIEEGPDKQSTGSTLDT